jgi:threonine aldolase
MENKRGFASDNNARVHPTIFKALEEVNHGHTIAYGDDPYTRGAIHLFKDIFGQDTEVFFVFLGTGANVLALTAATQSFHSILCAETAHIHVDECGAPEKFSGCKVIALPHENGKIFPSIVKSQLHGFGFEHHSQPKVISITQSTEMGTVYTIDEIKALADLAHENGMYLHMDGARVANAAVSLNKSFREITRDAGVDILSFGGTKNGMMYGEAILFFNPALATNFKYTRKQGMQLASKMRFISAQFSAYLKNDLWKRNAAHANKMASLLEERIKKIPGVTITCPVQANGVFAIVPREIIPALQEKYFFYTWNEETSEVRWMTSFDTTEEDVVHFANSLKELVEV